ncbi:hypothetical protein KQX54_002454 [Cotesia glomerata]|uniref:Uncharacterized protein n=1 Tax=Cotesia glomerata TaxID=32391 RepID=A0AAV7IY06_COTGL|nr:hypothetical protein KQX54_002454 [Cotesia glomerata]
MKKIDKFLALPSQQTRKLEYCCGPSNSSSNNGEVSIASEPQFKEISFYELMPLPLKCMEKTQRVRRKAINYRGTLVMKDLYDKTDDNIKKISDLKKRKTKPIKKSNFREQKNWYCHGCEEDEIADTRQFIKCSKRYHEACLGLRVDDTDSSKDFEFGATRVRVCCQGGKLRQSFVSEGAGMNSEC